MVGRFSTSLETSLESDYFPKKSSGCSWLLAPESALRFYLFSALRIKDCCLCVLVPSSLELDYTVIYDSQIIQVLAYKEDHNYSVTLAK